MEKKTMKPECNVNGHIIEYDRVLTKRDAQWEDNYVYIGSGTIHSIKGILQEDTRVMHFYHKIQ